MTASTHHDHPVRLTIGLLARRTGVPVRTIRFWSDEGLVPSDRSSSGHRVYDAAAVARLDLVRTLRELGLGLDDVRSVLSRRRGVGEIAQAHVRALESRIRELKAQRAVCVLLARTGPDDEPDERSVTLMNDLARLSAAERQNLIDDFVAETFAGTDPQAPGAGIAEGMRTLPSELPDDPTPEQVGAWVELAELARDPDFRARCREMAVAGSTAPVHQEPQPDPAAVAEHAGAALAAGVDPAGAGAAAVLARIPGVTELDAAARLRAADTIELFSDRRVERYWALLATLNGWPAREPAVPAFEWFATALRASAHDVKP
ncbi:MerR family transcriptional regulator [Pseudonocardia parietis]|uniref:DNA-binding transcriptional MerR regulator n=1 Tax=Pseudonocardia parietis TaxID=570936 RepID=A0ABS4VTA5_9PSEU|nr:MerR family transcriptional regulator [Pseudonocardia parietis]MBP2367150.1 DNA-binding transcriptional MerR regulator [Pseudonocardia parietis]